MPPGGHSTKLFINYRREDTAPYAGRLYDRLVAHFGEDQVFMDIDQIEPGEDFVEVINRKVGACEIAIISIGPKWLSVTDATGQRRLDDSEDLVRIEILAALDRKIRVIPVLVGGASMPRRQDLPEALAPLSRRNAIELSEMRFHADVSRLIEAIEKPRGFPEKKTETLSEPVVSLAEPPPPPKSTESENPPKTAALRPPDESPPVPVAPIAEPAPSVRLADLENLPKTSATPPPAAPNQPPNPPPAPRTQASAATTKKSKMPWILGGLGCFALLLLVLFVILISYVGSMVRSPYGNRLEYNGRELYYTSSVTEAQARKLAEYLVSIGFFNGNRYSVQLNKGGSIYEVRVWTKEGTEKNSGIASDKNLCRFISLNVFDGKPVEVHLCDTNMKTLRVLCP
jgi:hypothetical protein